MLKVQQWGGRSERPTRTQGHAPKGTMPSIIICSPAGAGARPLDSRYSKQPCGKEA